LRQNQSLLKNLFHYLICRPESPHDGGIPGIPIRKYIDDLFKDDFYRVRKSSYEWSSQNEWLICVNLAMNWRKKSAPEEKLNKVSELFNKVYLFVKNEDYNLRLVDVYSRQSFGFEFIFQPLVIITMDLLSE